MVPGTTAVVESVFLFHLLLLLFCFFSPTADTFYSTGTRVVHGRNSERYNIIGTRYCSVRAVQQLSSYIPIQIVQTL